MTGVCREFSTVEQQTCLAVAKLLIPAGQFPYNQHPVLDQAAWDEMSVVFLIVFHSL